MFGPLSLDMYLPALPDLAHSFQTPEANVQLTLTACMIGLAVGQLVAGPMSDAWGRKKPLADRADRLRGHFRCSARSPRTSTRSPPRGCSKDSRARRDW